MEVVDDDLTYAYVDSYRAMGPLKRFPTNPITPLPYDQVRTDGLLTL